MSFTQLQRDRAVKPWRLNVLLYIGPLIALLLWGVSLPAIRLDRLDDLGLVRLLPISFYAAFLLLAISFSFSISRARLSQGSLLSHLIVFILILHATPALVYESLRYPWVYKHLGLVEYIRLYGTVNPAIDAYHNWPGFFALWAVLTEVSGIPLSTLADLAQPFHNLIFLPPLIMLFRSFSRDARVVWLSVWLFYITNWVGQDYFAPQALAYFFYLTILAFLLRIFPSEENYFADVLMRFSSKLREWPWHQSGSIPTFAPVKSVVALTLVLLSFAVTTYSHQLTPFVLIVCVAALVAVGYKRLRAILLLFMAITAVWMLFMATSYLAGHLTALVSGIGALGQNVEDNFTGRLAGSQTRRIVLGVQVGLSLTLWIFAFLGFFRRAAHGYLDVTVAALALAPFPLLVLQPYGGEALLRLYFFTQPAMCLLAARFFFIEGQATLSAPRKYALRAVTVILVAAQLTAYYGNEGVNYVLPAYVKAFEVLYNTAPPGSLLLAAATDSPLRNAASYYQFTNGSLVRPENLQLRAAVFPNNNTVNLDALIKYMRTFPQAYLVYAPLRRTNPVAIRPVSPIAIKQLELKLARSSAFQIAYQFGEVIVYTLKER